MKLNMKRRMRSRHVWISGVALGLSVSACIAVVRSQSPLEPAVATTANQPTTKSDDHSLIYQNQEPVGWVFGRVVGFQGADKPLLRRQTLPAANPTPFR